MSFNASVLNLGKKSQEKSSKDVQNKIRTLLDFALKDSRLWFNTVEDYCLIEKDIVGMSETLVQVCLTECTDTDILYNLNLLNDVISSSRYDGTNESEVDFLIACKKLSCYHYVWRIIELWYGKRFWHKQQPKL